MKKLVSLAIICDLLISFLFAVPAMAKESAKDPISAVTISLVEGVGKVVNFIFTGES